jgi:hypothetical protein
MAGAGRVLISDVTASLVETHFVLEPRGAVDVKGLSEPLEVFGVQSERDPSDRRTIMRYRVNPLLGRDRERELLANRWKSFAEGHPTATGDPERVSDSVALVGPAGIGKTRVAWFLAELARRDGAEVLEAECSAISSGSDLATFRQLVARIVAVDPADGPGAQAASLSAQLDALALDLEHAAFVADLLALRDEVAPLPPLDPLELHQRTQRCLVELFRARANRQPVLLLLEDLQWADASTSEVVNGLIGANHPGLFVVVTARDATAVPAAVGHLLSLDPLDSDSCSALVRNVVGPSADDALIATMVERSEGVPLFADELARFTDYYVAGSRAVAGTAAAAVPPALAEIIAGRLDALGPDRHLAHAASVVGRDFQGALAVRLAGLDADAGAVGLRRLVDADLVESRGGDLLRLRHPLFHELAYETLLAADRQRLHEQLADWLLESSTADPSVVAFHLARGGRIADAVVHHQIAAVAAQERSGAHLVALRHLDECMRLARRPSAGRTPDTRTDDTGVAWTQSRLHRELRKLCCRRRLPPRAWPVRRTRVLPAHRAPDCRRLVVLHGQWRPACC